MHDRSQNQQRNHCFDISRNAANLKLDKRWGQWRNMLPTTRGDPLVELGGNLRAYEARGIQPPNWKPL